MHWKIKRLGQGIPASPPAAMALDPGLSDGAFRVYSWLLGKEDGDLDVEEMHRSRQSPAETQRFLDELESRALVTMSRAGTEVEVGLLAPGDRVPVQANDLGAMAADAMARSRAAAAAVAARRAANPGRWGKREKEKREPQITAQTIRDAWYSAWKASFPSVTMPRWTMREMGMAKNLIARLGPDDTLRMVGLVFQSWDEIVRRYGLRGYPSLEWCTKYVATAVVELLSGERIGKDFGNRNSPERTLKKGEFDERAASREEDVGWGDDA